MNISEIFIRRPVMTTLVMISILIFGFMAYRNLPVSDLPNVDFPTIQVSAILPGASPETMASAVATPLERQFTTIAGLDSMTSSSSIGTSQITLQFSLERNLDAAAQDVQAAIAKAAPKLPPGMPTPPSYSKVNPADQPILYIALTTPTLPLSTLNEYGETMLAQRISTVNGVAQVMVYGSQKYAVRLQLDPKALATRAIGLDEVSSAIKGANVNLPTGSLFGDYKAFTVQASGQLNNAEAYRRVVVAYRNGAPVRLEEVGAAVDSVENDKIAAWFYNHEKAERAIFLAIQRQPGTNTVAVAKAVRALLPAFKSLLPASVSLNLLFDRSESIDESVSDVKFTLLLTLGLVVVVIFLFLRNISATLIPSLSMPMSILGTFGVMYALGYSIDNLSLMALTLSVGFVVDDAIVMLENIVRHMEMGEGRLEAALNGSKEIGFTILSMTLSLTAVFIPILFMGGIVGRLFKEFAVTIGASVLISGFISLSLTPMLSSRFIHHAKEIRHGWLYRLSEKFFDLWLRIYEVTLRGSLKVPALMMIVFVGLFWGTIQLFKIVPKGFMPSEDLGMLIAMTEGIEGISFRSMVEHQKQAAAIVQSDPNIHSFLSSAGGRAGSPAINAGTIFIRLKARQERKMSADEIVQSLRGKLAKIPGLRAFPMNPPSIRIGGRLTKSLYQYTLQSSSLDDLAYYGPLLEKKMRDLGELQDISTDLQIKNPEVNIDIDRDKASALGVSVGQIEDALYSAYGTREVTRISATNNEYSVIMELKPEYQKDPSAIALLYIRSASGRLVPLDTIARISTSVGPLSVNHSGQLPSVTISFNLKPGVSLSDGLAKVNQAASQILPASITTSFQGTAQAFQSSMQGLGLLLILSIVVIYMVLGILYESFIHPLTILSALPLAGVGALVTLMYFKVDLSLYAFVGIIMLVGLVKKNGIMMVDFALDAMNRDQEKTPKAAIFEASLIRFRPIMMTTMAAIIGTLPIALGFGAGGESRRPLGLAVVGGLLFSQFLTLYVTPSFFVFMDWFTRLPGRLLRLLFPRSRPEQE